MKSFEKFQYDTSPYEIDEEVEELDEDLVGMVKKGITATGNVLDKAKKPLENIGTAVGNRVGAVKSAVSQSLQKGGVVPKPADRLPSTRRYQPGERTKTNTITKKDGTKTKKVEVNQKRTGSPSRTALADKQTRSTIASNSTKDNPKITPAGTKSPLQKLKDAGGIRSQTVRNVASIGNQIRKGLTAKPDQKISYDAKGSGFGGPMMGVGKNIQQAASNVGDAKLYKPTKVDSVTGKVKKGKVDQTVRDRLGLTSLVNTGKEDKTKDGKEVTQSGATVSAKQSKKERERAKKEAERKKNLVTQGSGQDKVTQGSGEDSKAKSQEKKVTSSDVTPQIKKNREEGDKLLDKINTQITDKTDKELEKTKSSGDEGQFRRNASRNNTNQNQDEIGSGVVDREGNPTSRFGKKQPFITYKTNNKNNKKSSKVTGDEVYTHYSQIPDEKQYSSKTPKLFEQFLFEIETRSTKKKKDGRGMHPHNEIKPMSGTNTITINPEDETSKYKRGY